jgi:hypothetical protein
MATDVSICNRALQILGADSIIALTDDNNRGRAMAIAYPAVRDAELRRHRWSFAIKRASLAALADAPTGSQFSTQFQLPNDCLRVLQVGDFDVGPDLSDFRAAPTELYSVEGRQLLTNFSAPLFIRYLARVSESLFDVAFAEALSARIAKEACYRITQSTEREQLCDAAYRAAIREATRANAFERATSSASDDTWVMAHAQ